MHVERQCQQCGRTIHVLEPGEGGRGIKVQAGDRFVVPAGSIVLSFDPTKSSGRFSRAGVSWFYRSLLFDTTPDGTEAWTAERLEQFVDAVKGDADRVLRTSGMLGDFNLDEEQSVLAAIERLKEQPDSLEFCAISMTAIADALQDALREGDAVHVACATTALTNFRAYFIFKQSLEDVFWRGYRIGGLRDALDLWTRERSNSDEEFWQQTLAQYAFVISQVFAYPVVILQDKAYVGGTSIDKSGANLVDFLLGSVLTDNVVLLEIKTPTTKLLGQKYRGAVYAPARELSGAVVQVTNYRDSLMKEHAALTAKSTSKFEAFDPPCLVIAGSMSELADSPRRKSFELFRQGLRHVQVITYDELFAKVEALIKLLE